MASIAFHLLLLAAVFGSAGGDAIRGAEDPFGDGEAMMVTLSGREGRASQSAADAAAGTQSASEFDSLFRRLQASNSDLVVLEEKSPPARSSLSELFDTIGGVDGAGRRGDGSDKAGEDGRGDAARSQTASKAGQGGQSDSAGELWGQVKPCWKKLPQRSAVPVTLEVALNAQGRLAGPPRIVRGPGDRPDEPRLIAEAKALTAIQMCLPYRQTPGGRNTYRLTFGSGR